MPGVGAGHREMTLKGRNSLGAVHRPGREFSFCTRFSAESQPLSEASRNRSQAPHPLRAQQPGDRAATHPPATISSQLAGSGGSGAEDGVRGEAQSPLLPTPPQSGFPTSKGLSPQQVPESLRGKPSRLSLGSHEPGTPPSGEVWGGDCPQSEGRGL